MIDYLIKSALCLAILLAVYSLLFEKEKMHRFNRFFLLFSLAFGLIIPAISLDLSSGPVKTIEFSYIREAMMQSPGGAAATGQTAPDISAETAGILMIVYGIVAGLLTIKFLVNLIRIATKVSRCPKIRTEKGVIILQDEKIVPHSFMNYVFLNKEDYSNKTIEEEIITHEFTHVRQKHSADILVIELLKIVFWFNPVFTFYKKAIQLNHEFLADESVITSSDNISEYQSMLLQTAGLEPVQLASNFNYSITKKRLIMMEKQFSGMRSMVKTMILIPLLAVLLFSCSSSSSEDALKDSYYMGAYIEFKNDDSSSVTKKYEQLTRKEKAELPSPNIPSEALLEEWQNADKYYISIDFRYAPNDTLSNFEARDFASYYITDLKGSPSKFIDLIPANALEAFKKLGGRFAMDHGKLTLKLPPPVIAMPAPPPPPPPPPGPASASETTKAPPVPGKG